MDLVCNLYEICNKYSFYVNCKTAVCMQFLKNAVSMPFVKIQFVCNL